MKNRVLVNLIWKFAERISAQLISTIVSIILARLLTPKDYGTVSMVMIFIAIANVFVSDGLGTALIQKKNTTEVDFYSVLYFNFMISLFLYIILFFAAPSISHYFGDGYDQLVIILRILGLRIILTSINSVQQAYISKKMLFRKFFVSTIWGTMISAIVGVIMAFNGFGVWALVVQYMVSTIVSTLCMSFIIKHRIKFIFSISSIRKLFPFGFRVLSTSIIITGFEELKALVVGKKYSTSDLAFYNKGRQFPQLIVSNLNASIGAVLFPQMSNDQDDTDKLKFTIRNSIRFSAYFLCPMMFGLAIIAKNFVIVILTEKWLPCVTVLQLFCLTYITYPMHTANMQAIKALGKSDVLLKMEIIKKTIEIFAFIITLRFGVDMTVFGMAICAWLFTVVNAYPNGKYIGYGFFDQIKEIQQPLIMSTIMVICVYIVGKCNMNTTLLLILQILIGALVYIFMSIMLKNKEFEYLKSNFLRLVRKKQND